MEKKLITPALFCLLIGFIFACFFQSCKETKSMAETRPTLFAPVTIIKTFKPQVKQDTPKVKRRTDAEMQTYLSQQYKLNYNQFFAPEFNKMNNVISKLAVSNKTLADILTSVRRRAIMHSDSMQKQNSFYIKHAFLSDQAAIHYQEAALKAQKDYELKLQAQTNSNNNLAISFIIGFIILVGIVTGLSFRVRTLSKKVDKLLQYE